METSAPTVTAFRSRAASVPGVNSALRTPGASSAMAKGAPGTQALDLIRLVAGLGENGGPITIQSGHGPVRWGELAHLDRHANRRHRTQRRGTVRGQHPPLLPVFKIAGRPPPT